MGRLEVVTATVAMIVAGCGRIGFDLLGTGGGSGVIDAARGDGAPAGDGDAASDPSLLLWLEMDTDPTVALVDASPAGNAVHCAGTGCPARVVGERGSGYDFVPSQQLVDTAMVPAPPFTVAAWVNLDAFPGDYACPICQPFGAGDADSFCLCVTSTGAANYFSTAAGNFDRLIGTPTMPLHQWHHLAMRYDGATKAGFFDGVADQSDAVGMDFDATHPVYVGGDFDGTPEFPVSGALDDVRIYTRELSDPEIHALATP